MPFQQLGLDAKILRTVQEAGYTEPTPIQAAAMPPVIAEHDLIGVVQTGTGKTAAFSKKKLFNHGSTRMDTDSKKFRV